MASSGRSRHEGDIPGYPAPSPRAVLRLSLKGARGHQKEFQTLVVLLLPYWLPEEVIPGNIAATTPEWPRTLQEGTHTRQASTTRSRCIG